MCRLGEELLKKETLSLPDIVEILGQRPYPMKDTLLEYLQELKDRRVEEAEEQQTKDDAAETKAKEDAENKDKEEIPEDKESEDKSKEK